MLLAVFYAERHQDLRRLIAKLQVFIAKADASDARTPGADGTTTKAWSSKTQRNVIHLSKALQYPPKEVGFQISMSPIFKSDTTPGPSTKKVKRKISDETEKEAHRRAESVWTFIQMTSWAKMPPHLPGASWLELFF